MHATYTSLLFEYSIQKGIGLAIFRYTTYLIEMLLGLELNHILKEIFHQFLFELGTTPEHSL